MCIFFVYVKCTSANEYAVVARSGDGNGNGIVIRIHRNIFEVLYYHIFSLNRMPFITVYKHIFLNVYNHFCLFFSSLFRLLWLQLFKQISLCDDAFQLNSYFHCLLFFFHFISDSHTSRTRAWYKIKSLLHRWNHPLVTTTLHLRRQIKSIQTAHETKSTHIICYEGKINSHSINISNGAIAIQG